jgi:hypothetical protein
VAVLPRVPLAHGDLLRPRRSRVGGARSRGESQLDLVTMKGEGARDAAPAASCRLEHGFGGADGSRTSYGVLRRTASIAGAVQLLSGDTNRGSRSASVLPSHVDRLPESGAYSSRSYSGPSEGIRTDMNLGRRSGFSERFRKPGASPPDPVSSPSSRMDHPTGRRAGQELPRAGPLFPRSVCRRP